MGVAMAFRKVSCDEIEFLQNASAEEWDKFHEQDAENSADTMDIDKSWDGIHWVLTGRGSTKPVKIGALFGGIMKSLMGSLTAGNTTRPEPKELDILDWVIVAGTEFGNDVSGNEPPVLLIPADKVQAIAQALKDIDENELQDRFKPEEMAAAHVYLSEFWSRDKVQGWEYLIENYRALKDFYTLAAEENKAVLRYVC